VAKYHHTEGICLRRAAFSNTSQVASFLTADSGRLSFIAKGVTRAPKKGVRTGLDLLGRYEMLYTIPRRGALLNLTYRWLREAFGGLRADLKRLLCGYYAAELALSFTAEGVPCPGFYDLMVRALRSFSAGRALAMNIVVLELGALREHGSCPEFSACAVCAGALPRRGAVTFSPAAGGPLCERCGSRIREGRSRSTSFRADALAGLALLQRYVDGEENPELEERLTSLPTQRVLVMSTVLRFQMRDVLGKELRMWKYLQQRELSRSLARARRRAGLPAARRS